ncbi:MAG: phosphotransferase [Proteobacteria bacterium]|nr:phosphotransferase [Pseudomonadota bacterium]
MTSPANYPGLSAAQQKKLPNLIQATALPMMYSDSTHQLWDCETAQGPLIVKICNSANVTRSIFWQGMQSLFAVNLPGQLGEFEQVFASLAKLSPLEIPEYIASGPASAHQQAFIAVKKLPGKMLLAVDVDESMVVSLARHIGTLHQHRQASWGGFGQAQFAAEYWPHRLQDSLQLLADSHANIPADILAEAIKLAGNCEVNEFVPIMPDLRWDQFLQHQGKLSALVDLDAFVFAPRELELVLLEYILDERQARVFSRHYQQAHCLPDLSGLRKPYRLLLYLINVLGEKNIDRWMQAPARF